MEGPNLRDFKMNGFKNDMNYNLVFLAGGPGLSSYSFHKLKPLSKIARLHFFDPMGTKSPLEVEPNYKNLLNEIKDYICDLENVILCGHSFGGIQAVDLAEQSQNNIKGLVCLATPISKDAFKVLNDNFLKFKSIEGDALTNKLASFPSNDVYKDWYIHFKDFYFNPSHSSLMIDAIKNDTLSVNNYSHAISEASLKENKLIKLKNKNIPKLLLFGEVDNVLPKESAQNQANLGGFELEMIKDAGHFIHYENPQQTIELIEQFIKGVKK